ncbi:MAG: nucleotidyltransferase family protein [Myxococcota bacterium]
MTSTFTAVVLAGSRGPVDPVASHCGISHKALAEIDGKAMIEHVLAAVSATDVIDKIIVVIERPEAVADLPTVRTLVDAGRLHITLAKPSPSQSVTSVLDEFDPYPALLTTADHPLLTTAMIEEFVERIPNGVDVAALVARDHVIQREYPETKRTYLRFSDKAVSGCNLFALPNPQGRNVVAFWRRLERDRKKPWKMAWALGPRTLIRFALRRLTMAKAADAVGRQAGVRAAIIESSFATAAIDVDKPSDLRLVRGIFARRQAS